MTKVLANDFDNDQVSLLIEFLTAMSNGAFARQGRRITGLARQRVKSLVRKFLHTNQLSEYNVLARADTFEIIRIRPEAKSNEDERLKHPFPFVLIPPPPTAVKPRLVIEWQGKPPTKKMRNKK